MTALEYFKAQAAELNRRKQEAIRTGTNQITYADPQGKQHTLYYINSRWVDARAYAEINRQFARLH